MKYQSIQQTRTLLHLKKLKIKVFGKSINSISVSNTKYTEMDSKSNSEYVKYVTNTLPGTSIVAHEPIEWTQIGVPIETSATYAIFENINSIDRKRTASLAGFSTSSKHTLSANAIVIAPHGAYGSTPHPLSSIGRLVCYAKGESLSAAITATADIFDISHS